MSAFKQMSDQLSGFLEAAEASHKSACQERDELKVKVATLEAAVRAVRADGLFMAWDGTPLDKLYALVPDGSEGGS